MGKNPSYILLLTIILYPESQVFYLLLHLVKDLVSFKVKVILRYKLKLSYLAKLLLCN